MTVFNAARAATAEGGIQHEAKREIEKKADPPPAG